ncbi:MAG: hypothetical protein VXY77_03610 [Pseudomonadota bacterium]|nr:hypothetical protein [Pseudomonadota bacterium]
MSEQFLNGLDMIIGTQVVGLEWQAMAYHYPKKRHQTAQLPLTGMGLQATVKLNPLLNKHYTLDVYAKNLYDKHKKYLIQIGASTKNKEQPHIINIL